MMKNLVLKSAALVVLAGLAACASTKTAETAGGGATETVVPQSGNTRPQGAAPGTQSDLEQNVGHRVFFGYNQYNLTAEAQATLARQAAWLKEYPESTIRLEGNCDERGTREYNLALGARRANAAKAYLISLGIDASRVTVVSYGKERPLDPRATPEAWAMNRNATSVLTSGTGA